MHESDSKDFANFGFDAFIKKRAQLGILHKFAFDAKPAPLFKYDSSVFTHN
jgi:hypothetical protein